MEIIIAFVAVLLLVSLIFLHGEYMENKQLKREIDDYQFCCDCVAKFKDAAVECVLVYSSEINLSRRLKFINMGYILTDEKEFPAARLPQLIKIQPSKSKITSGSNKQCSNICNNE